MGNNPLLRTKDYMKKDVGFLRISNPVLNKVNPVGFSPSYNTIKIYVVHQTQPYQYFKLVLYGTNDFQNGFFKN